VIRLAHLGYAGRFDVILGLAALARANVLVLIPVGLVWIWRKSRKQGLENKALAPAAFLLATLLVVSPTIVHNRLSGGKWALVSTNAAENWRIGNSYDSTGGFCYPEKGLIPVLSNDFLRLQLKKFGKLVSDYEEPNNLNFYLLRRDNLILKMPLLSWGFFLAFGLAGFFISWSRRRQLFPVYGYLVLYGLSIVAFFVTSRFRVPLWPVLILFSGYTFSRVVEAVRRKKTVYAVVALAAPLVLYFGLVHAAPGTIQPYYFDNMILLYQELGDTRGEIESLRDKLESYPDDPAALLSLAHYMQMEGRAAEALEMVKKVLATYPDLPIALRAAGFLELKLGNRDRAAEFFRHYLELKPRDPDSLLIRSLIAGERSQ